MIFIIHHILSYLCFKIKFKISEHKPSSVMEKFKNEGMRKDNNPVEWLISLHLRLNQPSSACKNT